MIPSPVFLPRLLATLLVAVASMAGPFPALAQLNKSAPDELQEVGVTEKLDTQIPLDLPFVDSDGNPVTLQQYFDGQRPVVLTLNYSDCPMLCILQLNGLFEALGIMRWDIGQQFEMVTVSIDPKETPERAKGTKEKYLGIYERPGSDQGYHVLTGRREQIEQLADTVGFRYRYVPSTGQYAHAAVTIIVTPDGRVSRYLYGVRYDPQTIRFSLLEAGQGKIGTTMDQILLFCFHYDADKGRYGPAAFRLMQLGGGTTVLVLGGVLLMFWRREKRRTRKNPGVLGETP